MAVVRTGQAEGVCYDMVTGSAAPARWGICQESGRGEALPGSTTALPIVSDDALTV